MTDKIKEKAAKMRVMTELDRRKRNANNVGNSERAKRTSK